MGDRTTRPYRPGDAAAVADFLNRLDTHVGGRAFTSADEVAAYVGGTVADVDRDTWIMEEPDGTLVAVGVVSPPLTGGDRIEFNGGVSPDFRRQGLGRDLFARQLDRATTLRAERGDQPWTAHVTVLVADDEAQRLYRRFGLVANRYWFDMRAVTAGATAAPVPAGLRVSDYDPAMVEPLYAAHVEAFADHYGVQPSELSRWVPLTVGLDTFRPRYSRIVLDGDEIAGYVLVYADTSPDSVYIGQIGVRRPWRRRGVAAALLGEVLTAAAADGQTQALLGVDATNPTGAVGVYERAGFEVLHRAVTYETTLA